MTVIPTPIPVPDQFDVLVTGVCARVYGDTVTGETCSCIFAAAVAAELDAELRDAGRPDLADQVAEFLHRTAPAA